jgi:hypothetical protein
MDFAGTGQLLLIRRFEGCRAHRAREADGRLNHS